MIQYINFYDKKALSDEEIFTVNGIFHSPIATIFSTNHLPCSEKKIKKEVASSLVIKNFRGACTHKVNVGNSEVSYYHGRRTQNFI